MAKNWMAKLSSLEGAINDYKDPHASVIQTRSPSVNFIWGNGWGLPLGFSAVFYGPPKAGKSVLGYEMIAGAHRDYEDGWVIRFDTEFRERGQLTEKMMRVYGIDPSRYKGIESNHPSQIYDQIEGEVAKWCADGLPLKLVVLDSMNGVQGRRSLDSDKGVMQQQIGDVAATNKDGLKRILPIQRKYGFSLIMTSHIAVEMDPTEQMRGNKYKMGASIGVQHHAEYFVFLEPNRNAAGRKDLLGAEMVDENMGDVREKDGAERERLAHKIRVTMKDSSMGPKGRHGEFTFSYDQGIVNTWEEIFLLGKNRGVIGVEGNYWKVDGFDRVNGQDNFKVWFKGEPRAQDAVLKALRHQDLAGLSKAFDAMDEAEYASKEVFEEKAKA